jgi:hypothetical protein
MEIIPIALVKKAETSLIMIIMTRLCVQRQNYLERYISICNFKVIYLSYCELTTF